MGDKTQSGGGTDKSGGGVGNKTNLRSKTTITVAAYYKMLEDCGRRAASRKEGQTKFNTSLSKGTSG